MFISDEVFDQGLDYADANGARVDLCSQEPVTYTEATATHSLANKTGIDTGAAEDGSVDGRRVIVPAITDGDVTDTSTATHWALTDGISALIATGALAAPRSFTSGNKFTLGAIEIVIRDSVAAGIDALGADDVESASEVSAPALSDIGDWLLDGGTWADGGDWDDSAVWEDS